MDLDRLIAACDIPDDLMSTLTLVMDGYSLRDIAELHEREVKAVEREFRNAVSLIVRKNNQAWVNTYARKRAPDQK